MESNRISNTHFIPPGKFLLMENALGNPDLIQSSVSSDCRVTIVDIENFPLDELEQWPTFRLTAADVKLKLGEGIYYIYIVVPSPGSGEGNTAFVSYNTVLVDRHGYDSSGRLLGKEGFVYYRCGTVSARGGNPSAQTTPSGQGRFIEVDLGVTPADTNIPGNLYDLEEVLQIDKVDPSNPASWLLTIVSVVKSMTANLVRITGRLIFGSGDSERIITGVATKADASDDVQFINDNTLATTAWVDAKFEQLDERYLSKLHDDFTPHAIGIGKDLSVGGSASVQGSLSAGGNATIGGHTSVGGNLTHKDFAKDAVGGAFRIAKNDDGEWEAEVDRLVARVKAQVYDLMVRNHATFMGDVTSEEFVSGFLSGKGWAIRIKEYLNAAGVKEKKSVAEVDDLIVRGSMRVYEFIVSQLLGENDNRIFTAMMEVDHYDASEGKIYLKTDNGKLYNPFRVDDVLVVQQYGGMPTEANGYYVTKQYELIVTGVGVGDMGSEDRLDWITFRNFTTAIEGGNESLISERDTLVRLDNLSDVNRKGVVQINSVGEDTPYIDFLYGAKTDPDNALKGRLGNLGGIYNPLFGYLRDFGAYLTNLYAVGEFKIAHTGEDVADAIEMAKGSFRTNFRQTTYDITEAENFFTNASFTNDCDGWVLGKPTESEYFLVDGLPQYFNRDLMATEETYAGIASFMGRDMLRLFQSFASQSNNAIRKPSTHKVYGTPTQNTDGTFNNPFTEEPDTIYLNIRMYCQSDGEFEFGFVDSDGTFYDNIFHKSRGYQANIDAYEISVAGTWDGLGDFYIRTTGDFYIDLLSLTDNPLENFQITTSTAIEQDATRISLLGKKVNGIEGSVTNLGIELNAAEERITAYVNKEVAEVGASVSQLQVDVNGISTTVASVSTTATNAQTLANTANKAASDAASKASAAQTTANAAKTIADDNATAIIQQAGSISLLAGAFTLQNGKYVLTSAAGAVITNEVASLYATKSSVSSLGDRVTTAEASIQVNADNITSKVSKNGVISSINQSSESVTINAAKINLNGAVTANNYFTIGTDGKISCSGGRIANFTITGSELRNFTNNVNIIIRNEESVNATKKAEIGLSTSAWEGITGLTTMGLFTDEEVGDNYNIALTVSAKNASENIGLYMLGGCIAGFAEKAGIYKNGDTITHEDTVAVAQGANIYLPVMDDLADNGHKITIISNYASSLAIHPSTPGSNFIIDGSSHVMSVSLAARSTVQFVFLRYFTHSFPVGDKSGAWIKI